MTSIGKLTLDTAIDLRGFRADRAKLMAEVTAVSQEAGAKFGASFSTGIRGAGLGTALRKELQTGLGGVDVTLRRTFDRALDGLGAQIAKQVVTQLGGVKLDVPVTASPQVDPKRARAAGDDAGKAIGQGIANGMPDLGGLIRNSILQANLITAVGSGLLGGVTSVIGGLTSALSGAMSTVLGDLGGGIRSTIAENSLSSQVKSAGVAESQNINMQAALSSIGGLDWKAAGESAKRTRAELAKVAAAQAGENKDYQELLAGFQDDLIKGFTGADGKLDGKELANLEKSSKTITANIGNIAANSGRGQASWNGAMNTLSKLMNGGTLADLRSDDFFQKDAKEAYAYIEKALKAVGARQMSELDKTSQVKLLEEAFQQGMSPERMAASAGTMDSQVQAIKSQLFDATSGSLSIQRSLGKDEQGADLSVFDSIKNTITELSNFFTQLGAAAAAAGLNMTDPMVILNSIIVTINSTIQTAAQNLTAFFQSAQGSALIESLNNAGTALGVMFGEIVANLPTILLAVTEIGITLLTLAADAIPFIVEGIVSFSQYLAANPEIIGQIVSGVINAAIAVWDFASGVGAALQTMGEILGPIVSIVAEMFGATEVSGSFAKSLGEAAAWVVAIGSALGIVAMVVGIVSTIGGAIAAVFGVISGIAGAISAVVAGIGAFLAGPVFLTIAAIAAAIGVVIAIVMNWGKIVELVQGVFKGIYEVINFISGGLLNTVKNSTAVKVAGDLISKVWNGISDWIKDCWTKAGQFATSLKPVKDAVDGISKGWSGFVDGIVNAVAQFAPFADQVMGLWRRITGGGGQQGEGVQGGTASEADKFVGAVLSILEAPSREGRVDVAQVISNRVGTNFGGSGATIRDQAFASGQFQPFFQQTYGIGKNDIQNKDSAIKALQKAGYSVQQATTAIDTFFVDIADNAKVADSAAKVGGRAYLKGVSEYGNKKSDDFLRNQGENFFHHEDKDMDNRVQASISALFGKAESGGGLMSGSGGVDASGYQLYSTGGGSELHSAGKQLRPHHNMRGAYGSRNGKTINRDGQEVNDMTLVDRNGSDRVAVPSPVSGRVTAVGKMGGYGNAVEIDTGTEKVLLAHLEKISVQAGQTISEGMQIGIQGGTGSSGSNSDLAVHVHMESSATVAKAYADKLVSGAYKGGVSGGFSQSHFPGDGHNHEGVAMPSFGRGASGGGSEIKVTRTGRKDKNGLEVLKVDNIINGQVVDSLFATSGRADNQKFESLGAVTQGPGSEAPLPAGTYKLGSPEQGDFRPEIGQNWIDILDGNTGSSDISGSKGRGTFGLHEDADRNLKPGSAGCVVFYDKAAIQKVSGWVQKGQKKLVVDYSTGSIGGMPTGSQSKAVLPSTPGYTPTKVQGPAIEAAPEFDKSTAGFKSRLTLANTLESDLAKFAEKDTKLAQARKLADDKKKADRENEQRDFKKLQSDSFRSEDAPLKAAQAATFQRKKALEAYDDSILELTRRDEDLARKQAEKTARVKDMQAKLKEQSPTEKFETKDLLTNAKFTQDRQTYKIDSTDFGAYRNQIKDQLKALKEDRGIIEKTADNEQFGNFEQNRDGIDSQIKAIDDLNARYGQTSSLRKHLMAVRDIELGYKKITDDTGPKIKALQESLANVKLSKDDRAAAETQLKDAQSRAAGLEANRKKALEETAKTFKEDEQKRLDDLVRSAESMDRSDDSQTSQSKFTKMMDDRKLKYDELNKKIQEQNENYMESLKIEGLSAEQKDVLTASSSRLSMAQLALVKSYHEGSKALERQLELDKQKEAMQLRGEAMGYRVGVLKEEAAAMEKYNPLLATEINRRTAAMTLALKLEKQQLEIDQRAETRRGLLKDEAGREKLRASGIGATESGIQAQAKVEKLSLAGEAQAELRAIRSKFPTVAEELREQSRKGFSDGLSKGLMNFAKTGKFNFGEILTNITDIFLKKGIDMITQNATNALFGGSEEDKGALGAMESASILDEGTQLAAQNIISGAQTAAQILAGAALGGTPIDGLTSAIQAPTLFPMGSSPMPTDGNPFSAGMLANRFSQFSTPQMGQVIPGGASPLPPMEPSNLLLGDDGALNVGTNIAEDFVQAAENSEIGVTQGGLFAGAAGQGLQGLIGGLNKLTGGGKGGKLGFGDILGMGISAFQTISSFSNKGGGKVANKATGGPIGRADFSSLRQMPGEIGAALRREGPNSVLAALTPGEFVLTAPEARSYLAMGGLSGMVQNFADGGVVQGEGGGNISIPVAAMSQAQNSTTTVKFESQMIGNQEMVTADQLRAAEARINSRNSPQRAVDMMADSMRGSPNFRRRVGL